MRLRFLRIQNSKRTRSPEAAESFLFEKRFFPKQTNFDRIRNFKISELEVNCVRKFRVLIWKTLEVEKIWGTLFEALKSFELR